MIVIHEDYYLLFEEQGKLQKLGDAEGVVSDEKVHHSVSWKILPVDIVQLSQCKRLLLKKTIKRIIFVKEEVN